MRDVKEAISFIDRILKSEDDDLKKEFEKMGLENVDETVNSVNNVEDSVSSLLEAEKIAFIDKINSGASLTEALDAVKAFFADDTFADTTTEEFQTFFTDFIASLTATYMTVIDPDVAFEVLSDFTTDFIKDWSEQLGKHLQLTSHNRIEKILTNGIEEGNSIDDIVTLLEDQYSWSRDRARKVALTEVLTAHSYSKQEAYMQSPAVAKIKWKHSGTKGIDARKNHIEMNGVTVAKDEMFSIESPTGVHLARFPRDVNLPPEERIHCHCTHGPVVDSTILGMTAEEKQALRDEALADWNKSYKSDKTT